MQPYSATILALYLAVGFVCSTTVLLEPLYAQPSSFVGPDEQPSPEDIPPEEPGFVPEPEDIPPGENPNFGPPVVPEVEEIIEDSVGSVEDTFSTINENSPVSPLLIGGIVAVVAIGAGVASFSRHHHGRSSSSHSTQDQTQQEDTEEEQIYEDVQIVTQGGIEEV